MSITYGYFGLDTLSKILIGDGRGAWRRWGIMDHEGPYFRLEYLNHPSKKICYLPLSLLHLLYARFRAANPGGVQLVTDFSEMEAVALQRYSQEEIERLYDERKILMTIDVFLDEEGYPLMRPYLPELFDPEVLDRIAKDPWLDLQILGKAESLGVEGGGISPTLWVDRSARWSPEWRAYCDRLMKNNPDYQSFE